MATREFISNWFQNTDDQARLVEEWQRQYYALVGRLGHIGTEVRVSRVVERDQDIRPYTFVREAFHEFIFPPQAVVLAQDSPDLIDPTPGYALQGENRTYRYDPSLVEGRIQVHYEDAGSRIVFSVTDMTDNAEEHPALEVATATLPALGSTD